MKSKKEILIASVASLVIFCFVWGFYYLKGKNILMHQHHYYSVYDRVDGLSDSRPLTFNGYRIGQVNNISLDPTNPTKIIVDFIVTEDIKIPSNSVARIYSEDIMGTKSLELIFGNDTLIAQPGDTLLSDIQATLQEEVNQQVLPLKLKAEELLSSLDTLMLYVNAILDKETRDNLSKSFADIQRTFKSLARITYRLDKMVIANVPRVDTLLTNFSELSSVLNRGALDSAITNFANFSDSLSNINIVTTMNSLNSSVSKLDTVLDKINNGEGTLSQLIHDDDLYENFEEASEELIDLLKDIQRNPNRYVHISLLGRNKSYKKSKDKIADED